MLAFLVGSTATGVLFINPGSARPRCFSLSISVAELLIDGERVTPRPVTLGVPPASRR
ncbi:MAG: hypothetical protein WA159_18555 [Variovorax sp.]